MTKMYRVYSIIAREKQDDYWLNIGVAFPHEDGKTPGNGRTQSRGGDRDRQPARR